MKNTLLHLLTTLQILFRIPRLETLANKSPESEEDSFFLVNQVSPGADNWVQLSPFGDTHNVDAKGKKVIQRFGKSEAETICNQFASPLNKILQPLGVPWYIGHPDHARFKGKAGHTDTRAKGRIKSMEVRHDAACELCNAKEGSPCRDHGLFAQVKWNHQGEEIIANEEFHGHSTNWGVARDKQPENGMAVARPVYLKSVGFTNDPNILVAPITMANEKGDIEIPDELANMAGVSGEDVTMDQVIAGLQERNEAHLAELGLLMLANAGENPPQEDSFIGWVHELLGLDPKTTTPDALRTNLEEKVKKAGVIDRVKKARATVDAAHKSHMKAHGALQEQLANAKTEGISAGRKIAAQVGVKALIRSGHIKAADEAAQIEALANSDDLDAEIERLANAKPVVKTKSDTQGLGGKNPVMLENSRERTAAFEGLLAKRAEEFPNESFQDSWNAVAKSEAGSGLLSQMKRPGEESDQD